MTFRLMKAFEIEANYQKHKQRLTSINGFNSKKKVTVSTCKNVELINNYKKHKLTAQIFTEKEKATALSSTNIHIQKTLDKVYKRDVKRNVKQGSSSYNLGVHHRNTSRSSLKTLSSDSRIKEENMMLMKKIEKTKSYYAKFRDTSSSRKDRNESYRHQLIKLLETQLGTKPKVVFPSVRNQKMVQDSKYRKSQNSLSKKVDKSDSMSKIMKK